MESVLVAPVSDFGVPDWWLMDHIIGYADECALVLISCIGAHGRTGTVIAAYAVTKGLCGDEYPIQGLGGFGTKFTYIPSSVAPHHP